MAYLRFCLIIQKRLWSSSTRWDTGKPRSWRHKSCWCHLVTELQRVYQYKRIHFLWGAFLRSLAALLRVLSVHSTLTYFEATACAVCARCVQSFQNRTSFLGALHSVQASVSSPGIDKTRRKANWPTHQGNWQGFWNDWKTLNHRNPALCRRTNVFCSAATLNTELRSNCKSTEAYTLYSFPTQNQTRRYGRRKDFFQGGGCTGGFFHKFF